MPDTNPFTQFAPTAQAAPDKSDASNPFAKFAPPASKPVTTESPGYDAALKEAHEIQKLHHTGFGAGPGEDAVWQGQTLGFGDELDSVQARGLTAAKNIFLRALGKPIPFTSDEAARAQLQTERESEHAFEAKHPLLNFALEGVGGFLTPGMEGAGKFIKEGGSVVTKALRGAAAGAGVGAVAGAGSAEGGPSQRFRGAEKGAVAGGIVGGAAEPAVEGASGGIKMISKLLGSGHGASDEVIAKLQHSLQQDGITTKLASDLLDKWRKSGAEPPELINLAGPNTRATIRDAAVRLGDARTKVVDYLEGVQENLTDRGQNRARVMTPETRSATELQKHLSDTRDSLADHQYAEPYATKVPQTKEILTAIRDPEGLAAVRRAMRGARSRQDYEQLSELQQFLSGIPNDPRINSRTREALESAALKNAPPISAAALDRIRIAFRELGQTAKKNGSNDIASGYRKRMGQLDTVLDGIPALKEARATYRSYSDQLRALDYGRGVTTEDDGTVHAAGGGVLQTAPDDFVPTIKKMSDAARGAAQVGARQSIIDALGKGRSAQPVIDRLAKSRNVRKNLEALFGPEEAERYTTAAKLELRRLKDANFISPEQGSKTSDVRHNLSPWAMHRWVTNPGVEAIFTMLSRVPGMSPKERDLLVQLGISPADSALKRILSAPVKKPILSSPAAGQAQSGIAGATAQAANQQ